MSLLDLDIEARLARDPLRLQREVLSLPQSVQHIVTDEVQKLPKLLDVIHDLIETHEVIKQFVVTDSSARKLKAGSANLLAGRAALRHFFPLIREEIRSCGTTIAKNLESQQDCTGCGSRR